jgi:hypothetical protein
MKKESREILDGFPSMGLVSLVLYSQRKKEEDDAIWRLCPFGKG